MTQEEKQKKRRLQAGVVALILPRVHWLQREVLWAASLEVREGDNVACGLDIHWCLTIHAEVGLRRRRQSREPVILEQRAGAIRRVAALRRLRGRDK